MPSPHSEFVPRYTHLRQVAIQLNTQLVKTLGRDVFDEGGKKLGILEGSKLMLESVDMLSVLMDFCIYEVRRGGLNTFERFLRDSPPPEGSDEMVILQAMLQARYSLFVIEGKEPGAGIHVRDLIRDEPLFLMDVSFSRSAPVGMLMAARIFAPDGITQTCGAALPAGMLPEDKRDMVVRTLLAGFKHINLRNPSREQASEIALLLIQHCLELGAAQHIEYKDVKPTGPSSRKLSSAAPRGHVGRNDPCPCGSGKKFKHCCGAPR